MWLEKDQMLMDLSQFTPVKCIIFREELNAFVQQSWMEMQAVPRSYRLADIERISRVDGALIRSCTALRDILFI